MELRAVHEGPFGEEAVGTSESDAGGDELYERLGFERGPSYEPAVDVLLRHERTDDQCRLKSRFRTYPPDRREWRRIPLGPARARRCARCRWPRWARRPPRTFSPGCLRCRRNPPAPGSSRTPGNHPPRAQPATRPRRRWALLRPRAGPRPCGSRSHRSRRSTRGAPSAPRCTSSPRPRGSSGCSLRR